MKTKNLFLFLMMMITPAVYCQEEQCDFGSEAQNHIDKGKKLMGLSYAGQAELLKAANEFEQALKYNPKCEDIYMTLADIYTKLGEIRREDMGYTSSSKYGKEILQSVKNYYKKATSNFEKAIKFSYDPAVKAEANQSLHNNYNTEYYFEENAKGKIKSLKHEDDLYKNTDGFFSIGAGCGAVFGQQGQMGVKASLFTQSKAGIGIVGGVGYPVDYYLNNNNNSIASNNNNNNAYPLLWSVGGGYSFGSYKCTFQLLGLYGKIQTRENFYENTGGLTLASNIKLFSDLALNLDVGYWLSDNSDIAAVFSFSAGLCYRFGF